MYEGVDVPIAFVTASRNERSRRAPRALAKVVGLEDRVFYVDNWTTQQKAKQTMRAGLHALGKQIGERLHVIRRTKDDGVRRSSGCNAALLAACKYKLPFVLFMDADDTFSVGHTAAMKRAFITAEASGGAHVFYPTVVHEVVIGKKGTQSLCLVQLKEPQLDDPPEVWAEFARYGGTFGYATRAFDLFGPFLHQFRADENIELVCRMKRKGATFVAVDIAPSDTYRYYQHLFGSPNAHTGLRRYYADPGVQTEVVRRALAGEDMLTAWFEPQHE